MEKNCFHQYFCFLSDKLWEENILELYFYKLQTTFWKNFFAFDQFIGYIFEKDYNILLSKNPMPFHYRLDSQKLEEWARAQNSSSLVEFLSKEGEVEETLKDISERAANGNFSYSRFFAVGLFRLLELANATEPTVLEKVCPISSCILQLNGVFQAKLPK